VETVKMQHSIVARVFDRQYLTAWLVIGGAVVVAVAATVTGGTYVLVNALVFGGMLALMAGGLALVFGVMNIAQFAHGELFLVGSLAAYYAFKLSSHWAGGSSSGVLVFCAPLVAIAAGTIAGAAVGVLSELLVFRPLRHRSRADWVMNTFLLTLGLSVMIQNGDQVIFTPNPKGIVQYWPYGDIPVLGVSVSFDRVATFVLAISVIALFWAFLKYARMGRAIRAVAQDANGSQMVGIESSRIFILVMALSGGMAALAGATLLYLYPSYPTVGLYPLYMSWFVLILVGLTNSMGALVGGFIVGLVIGATTLWLGTGWDMVIPSAIVCLILIIKPNGIFGSAVRGVSEI
jgi:branched-chain amino acid transport system permease protein